MQETKDTNAKPLVYQCDLRRLTQLFGRQLQMKYYNKNVAKEAVQVVNEEGDIMQHAEAPAQEQDAEIDVLFEDVQGPDADFRLDVQKVQNLKDMFQTQQKQFDSGGFTQQIVLNPFAIRKQVDVKRLKH